MTSVFSLSTSRGHLARVKVKSEAQAQQDRQTEAAISPWVVLPRGLEIMWAEAPSSLSPANTWSKDSGPHFAEEDTGVSSFCYKPTLLCRKSTLLLMDATTNSQDTEAALCRNGTLRLCSQTHPVPACHGVMCKTHPEFWFLHEQRIKIPTSWGYWRLETMKTKCLTPGTRQLLCKNKDKHKNCLLPPIQDLFPSLVGGIKWIGRSSSFLPWSFSGTTVLIVTWVQNPWSPNVSIVQSSSVLFHALVLLQVLPFS